MKKFNVVENLGKTGIGKDGKTRKKLNQKPQGIKNGMMSKQTTITFNYSQGTKETRGPYTHRGLTRSQDTLGETNQGETMNKWTTNTT